MSRVSLTLWSVMKILIPLSFKCLSISLSSIIAIGSKAANGSSNNNTFGEVVRHLAISTLLASPPDKLSAEAVLRCAILNSLSKCSTNSSCFSSSLIATSATALIFSSTVNPLNIDLACGR